VLDSRVPQLLAAFLLALGQGQGQGIDRPKGQPVTVLDLGGATGHHFFALAPFLTRRWQLDWTVCELPALAQAGATAFGDRIKFVSSLDQLGGARFDVVLASGSLQYVPEPGPTCEALLDRCDHLIINRSPFVAAQKADRLTVQEVQTEQGPIRYPAWFLSRDGWFDRIRRRGFKIELCWPNPEDHVVLDGETIGYSGLLARRRGADEVP
jgi:putative methyltransferase (TIGR04325 family)